MVKYIVLYLTHGWHMVRVWRRFFMNHSWMTHVNETIRENVHGGKRNKKRVNDKNNSRMTYGPWVAQSVLTLLIKSIPRSEVLRPRRLTYCLSFTPSPMMEGYVWGGPRFRFSKTDSGCPVPLRLSPTNYYPSVVTKITRFLRQQRHPPSLSIKSLFSTSFLTET